MKTVSNPTRKAGSKTVLTAAGVLMVVGLMVWLTGRVLAADNNTTNSTNETPIDWNRLESEIDDKSGLTERLNDIADIQNQKLAKINEQFNKEVEDISANKKLTAQAKERMLKNALRKKKQQSDQVNKAAARDKSLADGTWKAQNRSAHKITRTYSSGGYWQAPVPSGSSSSGGSSAKPLVLPCVNLDSIKPKIPTPGLVGGGTSSAVTQPTTTAR